jgi:hypothetical protein
MKRIRYNEDNDDYSSFEKIKKNRSDSKKNTDLKIKNDRKLKEKRRFS